MPTIKVKDLNFYYEFHGEGEPVVLISGTAISGRCLRRPTRFISTSLSGTL
ncbi:MAG: hypothetical protein V3W37_11085 [Candidatus Binatia bacterium]